MSKNIFIDSFGGNTIGVLAEDNRLIEYHIEKTQIAESLCQIQCLPSAERCQRLPDMVKCLLGLADHRRLRGVDHRFLQRCSAGEVHFFCRRSGRP